MKVAGFALDFIERGVSRIPVLPARRQPVCGIGRAVLPEGAGGRRSKPLKINRVRGVTMIVASSAALFTC
ncbi:hypothetical protein [Rhodoblastus sp.]|jgi:preprotein translocase subunit SecY|uniref:hypothetical protein n=1 Tax=Rhodoblastus sp. TaxID=1962975 RepID=UPI0025DF37B2|nr:hypothetical protein [Rhodoblastus sp.]